MPAYKLMEIKEYSKGRNESSLTPSKSSVI